MQFWRMCTETFPSISRSASQITEHILRSLVSSLKNQVLVTNFLQSNHVFVKPIHYFLIDFLFLLRLLGHLVSREFAFILGFLEDCEFRRHNNRELFSQCTQLLLICAQLIFNLHNKNSCITSPLCGTYFNIVTGVLRQFF